MKRKLNNLRRLKTNFTSCSNTSSMTSVIFALEHIHACACICLIWHEVIQWTFSVVQPWVAPLFADRWKSVVPCKAQWVSSPLMSHESCFCPRAFDSYIHYFLAIHTKIYVQIIPGKLTWCCFTTVHKMFTLWTDISCNPAHIPTAIISLCGGHWWCFLVGNFLANGHFMGNILKKSRL